MNVIRGMLITALCVLAGGAMSPAHAQATVASTDIQRLQDMVYDVGTDIARLRSRDSSEASQLQSELDNLREEVIYLKVKMRKERSVSRAEYSDLRDRLESLRSQTHGDSRGPSYGETAAPTGGVTGGTGGGVTAGSTTSASDRDRDRPYEPERSAGSSRPNEVPVGQELDVRLQTALSSKTAEVEDRFEATTLVDLMHGDRVLIPAGSLLRGVVSSVDRATRMDRKGSLTVTFDQLTVNGRSYPIRGTVTEALESEGIKGEAARIGTGAGVGAIIGGILGGVKGALAGILIGGGGTVAATEGTDVNLPAGTVLRVRLDSPLTIR